MPPLDSYSRDSSAFIRISIRLELSLPTLSFLQSSPKWYLSSSTLHCAENKPNRVASILTRSLKLLSTITSLVLLVLGAQAVAIGDVSSPVDLLERDTSPNLEGRQSGSPITWNEWTCGNPSGGGGHTALKNIHAGFNRVFGGPRLTAVAGQCYVANCHGHFFAWCNTSGYTVSYNSCSCLPLTSITNTFMTENRGCEPPQSRQEC